MAILNKIKQNKQRKMNKIIIPNISISHAYQNFKKYKNFEQYKINMIYIKIKWIFLKKKNKVYIVKMNRKIFFQLDKNNDVENSKGYNEFW